MLFIKTPEAMPSRRLRRICAISALAAVLAAPQAWAATITVDTNVDESSPNGNCSLREAIESANLDGAQGSPGALDCSKGDGDDVIVLSATGPYVLDENLGELLIADFNGGGGSDNLTTITGNNQTIDGNEATRIFSVRSRTVINDLNMTRGFVEPPNDQVTAAGEDSFNGAAINAAAPLTINGGSITSSEAIGGGGAGEGSGGGIFASADLTLMNVNMSGNIAERAGGAIEIAPPPLMNEVAALNGGLVTLTINGGVYDSNLAGNGEFAFPGNGGAIHITDPGGEVTSNITSASFTNNIAEKEGGALWNGAGTMTVDGVTVTGNEARGPNAPTPGDMQDNGGDGGGGIFNNRGTLNIISLAGATLIDNNEANGAAGSGGGILNNNGAVFIDDFFGSPSWDMIEAQNIEDTNGVTISNNRAVRAGGGIESVGNSNEGCPFDNLNGDFSASADVIRVFFPGDVYMAGVTLSSNSAGAVPVDGGAPISAAPGNGGGLHLTAFANGGIRDLGDRRSTVSSNTADSEGGGLWNARCDLDVEGTDIAGNEAAGPNADNGGGGIFNNGGFVEVEFSTITGNIATGVSGSGGGILSDGGLVEIEESLIALNQAPRAGGGIELTGGATLEASILSLSGNNAGNVVDTVGTTLAQANPGNGGGLHITFTNTPQDATASGLKIRQGALFNLSLITDNTAAAEGGGLWNDYANFLAVNASSVLRNSAAGAGADQGGGGIFNNGGRVEVTNSRILANDATGTGGSGGGVLSLSAASQLGDDEASLFIQDSDIAGNTAMRAGGGIEVRRDENSSFNSVALTRINLGGTNTASGNITMGNPGNGGGLHITGRANVDVRDSLVGYNSASEGGGLWNSAAGTLSVENSTLSNNSATGNGGGLYADALGDTEQTDGNGSTFIRLTTVARNSAGGTGGGLGATNSPRMNVSDSLVAENSSGSGDANLPDGLTPGSEDDDGLFVDDNTVVGNDAGFNGVLRLYGSLIQTPENHSPAGFDCAGDRCDSGPSYRLPTAVHPLTGESMARDVAELGSSLDQRGAFRPDGQSPEDSMGGGLDDVGSFELANFRVINVTDTAADSTTVTENDEEVVLFGFQMENQEDQSVLYRGFSGRILVNNLPASFDFGLLEGGATVALFEDTNANGQRDDGEQPVDGASVFFDLNSLRYFVDVTEDSLAAAGEEGDSIAFVAVAFFGQQAGIRSVASVRTMPAPASFDPWRRPAAAGGAMLGLLALFSVGRVRRRVRLALLVSSAAIVLTACGGGGGGGGGGDGAGPAGPGVTPPAPNPLTQGDLQFTVDALFGDNSVTDEQVDQPNDLLIGDGLPIDGPALTIESLAEPVFG